VQDPQVSKRISVLDSNQKEAAMAVPAPGKSCGSCTECCKIVAVDELQKPGGVYCSHCTLGGGCKIYPDRPQSCRTFMCGWLVNARLGPELKPDRCHVVLMDVPELRVLLAGCDPDRPDAWRAPVVLDLLRQLAMTIGSGWRVIAAVDKRTWLITERAILSESGEVTPLV
jgi:uncharacterized protein